MNRRIVQCFAGTALVLGAWTAQAAPVAGAERVALVIGNSAYPAMALGNPANDARDIAELLKQAGFQVELQLDTTRMQLFQALQDFGEVIKDKRTKFAIFYYAGHGAQQAWRNFLIPVDANVQTGDEIEQMAVDLQELTTEMARTRDRNFLLILDACRDDPFGTAFRPAVKGLSQYDAPAGSLLAYATGPGHVASDGSGRNGLYTTYLLRELSVKGARVEDAFKRVRLGVRLASRGRQIPWESTSLEDDLYIFAQPRKANLSNAEQEKLLDAEIDAWRVAKTTNSVDSLAGFLREYPSGNVSELAQARLNALLREQAPRPRLARLHVPDAPSALPAEKIAMAAASMPIVRAAAEPAADAAPAVVAAAPAAAAALPSPPPQSQAPVPIAVAKAEPPAPVASQVEAASAAVASADAPESLTVPATPMYQGAYENVRHFQVGDVFRFQLINRFNGTATPQELRVTAVDAAKDEVTYNNGDFVSDTMGNVSRNQRGTMDSPRQFYPAELYLGRRWTTMFRQTRDRGTYNTFRYQLRVVAKETVTVPAGRFDAFKIEARGFNLQRGAAIERDIWVAPGVDADIAHETKVRLANGMIEQYDRQELVAYPRR